MLGLIHLFRSSSPAPPTVSLIDDATTIIGDTIVGAGDLRIEGTVRADIKRKGRVVIAQGGTVHGTIRAQSIRVAGMVRGTLHAEETLDLTASANVRAHLLADELSIDSGANFKGPVHNGAAESMDFPSSMLSEVDQEQDSSHPPPFIQDEALPELPVKNAAA